MKEIIHSHNAPQAIGAYSQAIKVGNTIYLSGQIPLIPSTMELVNGSMQEQLKQIFTNLSAVAKAANAELDNIVKLTVFLTDLSHYTVVNEVMENYFSQPYPARTLIGVAALPKQVAVEIDAILVLP